MQMQQPYLESDPRLLFTSRPDRVREVAGWAVLAAAAVALAYRFSRRRLTLAGDRGIHVRESIRVEKPRRCPPRGGARSPSRTASSVPSSQRIEWPAGDHMLTV